jgi:hypothetical protein
LKTTSKTHKKIVKGPQILSIYPLGLL